MENFVPEKCIICSMIRFHKLFSVTKEKFSKNRYTGRHLDMILIQHSLEPDFLLLHSLFICTK